jgi:catechol 2,3-dioxygenase-like lactoylglutathione lyase family enzyme
MRQKLFILISLSLLGGCSWLVTPPSRVDNPVVAGVNFVGVTVSDLNQTEKLYRDATEIQVVKSDTITDHPLIDALAGRSGVSAQTRLMKGVNAQVLLMQFDNPSEQAKKHHVINANGPGLAHLAFQVADKTQTYQKFLAGGAKHIGDKEMLKNPKTQVSYAYVRDLDNVIVEVEHVDIESLNLPKPPKNNRRIRHISLATTDMDRLIDFYSILLETQNPRQFGHMFHHKGERVDKVSGLKDSETEMAWFQVRNLELEIIQYHNPVPRVSVTSRPLDAIGYNMVVFDVTDLNAAKEKFVTAGGKIVSEKQEWNEGEIFFGHDPDGNLLGFQTLAATSIYSAKNFKNNGLE